MFYGRALEIWQEAGLEYGAMAILNNRALLNTRAREWNSALRDFQDLLRSPQLTEKRLRAAAENNIGLVYQAVVRGRKRGCASKPPRRYGRASPIPPMRQKRSRIRGGPA